ncbi:MAG: hypothetical protein Q8Q18_01205 [bacterium]|nr:hypothetical protein [bacterium]
MPNPKEEALSSAERCAQPEYLIIDSDDKLNLSGDSNEKAFEFIVSAVSERSLEEYLATYISPFSELSDARVTAAFRLITVPQLQYKTLLTYRNGKIYSFHIYTQTSLDAVLNDILPNLRERGTGKGGQPPFFSFWCGIIYS